MQAAYATWLTRDMPRHPDTRIVFAILAGGAPLLEERWRSRGADLPAPPAGVLLDTASFGAAALDFCFGHGHGGRLVFGSDAPILDPSPVLEAVRGLTDGAAVLARGGSLLT